MQIVPNDDSIEVEALLDSKDIGFVKEGQPVAVKVDAFEYVKYGTLQGVVSHISRDSIQNDKDEKKEIKYAIKVKLNKSSIDVDGTNMKLLPGMSGNIEIKTGERGGVLNFV